MPRRTAASTSSPPSHCFVAELPGENPPSLSEMKTLYDLASEILAMRPWEYLDDTQLTLVQAGSHGELCYCCVMGALGEAYVVQAYIGSEAYRLFCDVVTGAKIEPGEFYARQRSVYLEFVPRNESERQDRELLAWLGHVPRSGPTWPTFRASRPGFLPWFVNAEEARVLAECLRATIEVARAVIGGRGGDFWPREGVFPMATREDGADRLYRLDLVEAPVPEEASVPAIRLDHESLARVRSGDYAVRGSMELDFIFSGAPIGKKNERKSCASVAIAVDGETGMVYAPYVPESGATPVSALGQVFLNAVESSRAVPREVRLRTQKQKEALSPLFELFGVSVRATPKLRAADDARRHLLAFLGGSL